MSASLAIDEFAFFSSQLQFLRFEFDFSLVTHRNAFPFAFVATGLKFLNRDLFLSIWIVSVGLDIDVLLTQLEIGYDKQTCVEKTTPRL